MVVVEYYQHSIFPILQKILIQKFCTFRIVPIYESCSESCKADYLSNDVGCCGSDETNIPKSLQCPNEIDLSRFYYSSAKGTVMGKCFKETPKDNEGPNFDQLSPHHCKYATANRLDMKNSNTPPNVTNNDTFFNEYSISLC